MSADPDTDTAGVPATYSVGPRLLRVVCWVCAILVLVGVGLLLWAAPGTATGSFEVLDSLGWILVALFVLTVLWRFGQVRVFVSPQGVKVRNFFVTKTFTWPEILGVSMTTSDNWAVLELSDGGRCMVLALATSEGRRTQRCVVDLRTRIILYGEAPGN